MFTTSWASGRLELAHAFPASWADACSGILDDDDLGLNDFGLEVVRECNRLGILVDLSHSSDQTMEEAIEASEKPVIASHSGARGVVDAVRNLTEDQIKALAQKGGLIAVGAMYDPKHLEPIRKTGAWITMAKVNNYLLERYPDPFRLAAAIRNSAETQAGSPGLGPGAAVFSPQSPAPVRESSPKGPAWKAHWTTSTTS